MIKLKEKKILCDYEYYTEGILAGGMITLDENRFIKILQGIVYNKENEMKRIGMFTWNIENNSFDMIKTEDQELISKVISDILVEVEKEGL